MCYGTRDAGKLWEDAYTVVLQNMELSTGVANPCIFHHAKRDLMVVVHGDDVTTLGPDSDLDRFEGKLQESFEIKCCGRLGEGCPESPEIRILNRVVSVNSSGLTYEADPRHCDLLMSSLGLSESSKAATPGVKPTDRDEFAEKSDEPDDPRLLDYSNPDAVIAALCAGDLDPLPCGLGPIPCNAIGEMSARNNDAYIQDCNATVNDLSNCPENQWITHGENDVWTLQHSSKRRTWDTSCKLENGPRIHSLPQL